MSSILPSIPRSSKRPIAIESALLPIKRRLTADDVNYLEENDRRAAEAHQQWTKDKNDRIKSEKERNARMSERDNSELRRRMELFDGEQNRLVEKWLKKKDLQREMVEMKKVEFHMTAKVEQLKRSLDDEEMEKKQIQREKKFDPSFSVSSDPLSGPSLKKNTSNTKKRGGIALPPLS